MYEKIQKTASWLKERMTTSPKTAIILGTGLGQLASEITDSYEFAYSDIPNFPVSTVEGHAGKLIFGKLGGKDIMAMEGRFHFYEGYNMKEVTFPERVMYELGITTLFVSNASGGMNPDFHIGDLMVIDDHINFFPEHPLHGKNFPTGPRFPDMHEAYDKSLRDEADQIAHELGITLRQQTLFIFKFPLLNVSMDKDIRNCYANGNPYNDDNRLHTAPYSIQQSRRCDKTNIDQFLLNSLVKQHFLT